MGNGRLNVSTHTAQCSLQISGPAITDETPLSAGRPSPVHSHSPPSAQSLPLNVGWDLETWLALKDIAEKELG
jgi:hypothetical protein